MPNKKPALAAILSAEQIRECGEIAKYNLEIAKKNNQKGRTHKKVPPLIALLRGAVSEMAFRAISGLDWEKYFTEDMANVRAPDLGGWVFVKSRAEPTHRLLVPQNQTPWKQCAYVLIDLSYLPVAYFVGWFRGEDFRKDDIGLPFGGHELCYIIDNKRLLDPWDLMPIIKARGNEKRESVKAWPVLD